MMRRLLVTCGVVLGLSLVAVPKASATTFQLNDIYCNCLPAGSTNGGTVDVTASGGNLTFVVNLNDLLNFHYSNAFDLFGFNYDGPGTLSLVGPIVTQAANGSSVSSSGWGLTQTAKSGAQDGAGNSFNWFIDCASCSGGGGGISGVNILTFTISSSGKSLVLGDVAILSGNNVDFSAAVTRTTLSGCTGVIGGGNGTGDSTSKPSTGIAADGINCGATVPDGGTTAGLLGLGMLGLAYLRRRMA
jgi:hypothetical protein